MRRGWCNMDQVRIAMDSVELSTIGDPPRGFHAERRGRGGGRAALRSACVVIGMLLLGCSGSAPRPEAAPPPAAAVPPAAAAGSPASAAAPAPSQADAAPRLETVKVATQPILSFAPVF